MKNTSTPNDTSNPPPAPPANLLRSLEDLRQAFSEPADGRLTARLFQDGSGKQLIKFCREVSAILIRSCHAENGVADLRDKLCASIMATLACSDKQALSLIELSLELIHAKVHGTYRRTEVELSYLIAAATGAVCDVSSN